MKEPTAADLVKRYTELDDYVTVQGKKFDEFMKPVRGEMEQIKAKLHELLLQLGSKDKQSISTDYGTAYTSTIMSPKISEKGQAYVNANGDEIYGRDAFLDYCLDHWDQIGNEMLQIGAPQKDAVKRYIEENNGALPPGVQATFITKVNIRRS